ncbi:baseplate wedge subunit and tail pin [Klebsiella phage CPRSB]|nr:baseplate wedge subunit and tail pin [Klebsiella phage CPRSB]
MKQEILIGQVVDNGTGDYLRRGGQKTNNNFTELITCWDGEIPHPAGAWKTFAGTTLSPKFGESWALNTSANKITVNLPKGGVGDYNKVIRLRDVWSRWATNNVRLIPQLVILSKVPQLLKDLFKDFMDVELVYCSPAVGNTSKTNRLTKSQLRIGNSSKRNVYCYSGTN